MGVDGRLLAYFEYGLERFVWFKERKKERSLSKVGYVNLLRNLVQSFYLSFMHLFRCRDSGPGGGCFWRPVHGGGVRL